MVYKQNLRVLLPCGESDKQETNVKYRFPWFMGKIRNMKKALIRSEEDYGSAWVGRAVIIYHSH